MEYLAEDYRSMARDALRGHWLTAILTSFVASLIGAWIVSSGSGGSDLDSETFPNMTVGEIPSVWFAVIIAAVGVLVVYAVVLCIIGGAGTLGYARFNLKLVDGERATLGDLFSQFHRIGEGFLMNLLMGLYIFLWSLLFIIPGIMKSYSYAMTPYILAENSHYTANDAISESCRIMDGNRWRLFCLHFSFIGWELLCAVPSVIGLILAATGTIAIWLYIPFVLVSGVAFCLLHPYMEAAQAAFYRDITTEVYHTEDAWNTENTEAL